MANTAPPILEPVRLMAEHEGRATAVEWGMHDVTFVHQTPIPAEYLEGWDEPGYLYECIGVEVREGEQPRHAGTFSRPNEDGTDLAMTAYRARAYPVGSVIFLEKVFHPDQPFTIDMRGLETMPDEPAVRAAWKALPILTTFKPWKVARGTYPKVYERHRAAWRLMRPVLEQGKSYTYIAKWLSKSHPELIVTTADSVETIAKKGRDGQLD